MIIKKEIKRLIVLQSILVIIGVLLILSIQFEWINQLPVCVFREKYGFICPTCGVTRCVIEFLNMNFKASFLFHPTFFILILYVGIVNCIYIINTIWKKRFLKFLYPSLSILNIILTFHVVQYLYRICMLVNGVGLEYL